MSPRNIIMIIIPIFILLGMLSPAPATGFKTSKPCCTRYTKKPIPFHHIKGYREQINREHCRISAIIFYTMNNHEVCANPTDEWVNDVLSSLSSRLKAMSRSTRDKTV